MTCPYCKEKATQVSGGAYACPCRFPATDVKVNAADIEFLFGKRARQWYEEKLLNSPSR